MDLKAVATELFYLVAFAVALALGVFVGTLHPRPAAPCTCQPCPTTAK